MFGRSSNAVKAMNDVQRIKNSGGTADLSFSQIVCLICNSQDAEKNLSPEEFSQFRLIFDNFRKMTKCSTVDMSGYLDMCKVIIGTFEKYFPYLLVDGEHSENLELRNQIKIRKLYADGYRFENALSVYEEQYDTIPLYRDYDPMKMPQAKQVFSLMEYFMSDFIGKYLFSKASVSGFGILSGVADAIYLVVSERFAIGADKFEKALSDFKTEENAITMYTMIAFGINGYSDSQIDTIMKKRLEIASKYYQEGRGKPTIQMLEKIANDLIDTFTEKNPEINYWAVRKSLVDYHQNIFNLITSRLS